MMRTATILLVVFLVGLIALVVSGCLYNEIDLPSCTETIPCLNVPDDPCPDITSDRWISLGLENESVTAIAVHPCNPGIIYAGTQFRFSDGVQGKLFKTTDCGASWDTLVVGGSYRTIQLNPGNPDVMYAVNGGILKSSDAGASWERADEGIHIDTETRVASLAITPQNACQLYAGTGGSFGGDLYKSTDAGASWRLIEGKGLKENRLANGVISLAIDPADPDQVFAGTAWAGDVLRSTDGGDRWETTGLNDTGSLVHSLLIYPTNGTKVYAGLNRDGLHISKNSGKNWDVITNEFLAHTTSIVELEMDELNKVLHVVTTYGDSGGLLAYNFSNGTWKELPVPITDKSFYYSKLNISAFAGKGYKFFGVSGLYAMFDE